VVFIHGKEEYRNLDRKIASKVFIDLMENKGRERLVLSPELPKPEKNRYFQEDHCEKVF